MNLQMTAEPVVLDVARRRAVLRLDGEDVERFEVRRVEALTRNGAQELLSELDADRGPWLVVFERSSPDARALLREGRVSYAAGNGELFVFAPPVYVERPARRPTVLAHSAPVAPFAARASRVARWLLLHEAQRPSLRELAHTLGLSEALVSRAARALADDGLLVIERDHSDGRIRRARVRDAGALLDAFERSWVARRLRRITWDVGARDAAGAMEILREAQGRVERPYVVGGLAGAALVRRVVEPADVTLWIDRDDVEVWERELLGTLARGGAGRIVVQLAPDPFMLTSAQSRGSIRVADPVQLYLDCRRAGERALEAAEAIRGEMGW